MSLKNSFLLALFLIRFIPLDDLEKTKDELTFTLSSGELSNEELMKNGTALGKVVEEIDSLTERWIELAEFI